MAQQVAGWRANSNLSALSQSYGKPRIGAMHKGVVLGRPDDAFGVRVACTEFSSAFRVPGTAGPCFQE